MKHHADDAAGPPQLLLNLNHSAKMAPLQLTLWAVYTLLQTVLSLMLCQRLCILALRCLSSLIATLHEVGICHKLPKGRNRQAWLKHLIQLVKQTGSSFSKHKFVATQNRRLMAWLPQQVLMGMWLPQDSWLQGLWVSVRACTVSMQYSHRFSRTDAPCMAAQLLVLPTCHHKECRHCQGDSLPGTHSKVLPAFRVFPIPTLVQAISIKHRSQSMPLEGWQTCQQPTVCTHQTMLLLAYPNNSSGHIVGHKSRLVGLQHGHQSMVMPPCMLTMMMHP